MDIPNNCSATMFSSTTNTNSISTTTLSLNNNMSPFPHYYFSSLSSSSSSPPPLNYNHHLSQTQSQVQLPPSDRDDHIFFHQNNQYDSSTFPFPNNNNIPEITQINFGPSNTNIIGSSRTIMASFYSKQENNQLSMINNNEVSILSQKKKPASKKDRHSKIHTAQGLRDRRVRLSIDIAREFFDLHDTLGFDKASKTLEWLLRKSKKAIVEVSRSGSKSFSSAANCQSEIDQVVSTEDLDQTLGERANPAPRSKALALKESRAKARARARARTREKKYNSPSSSGNGIKRIDKCHNSSSQIWGQLMEANYQLVRDCGSDDQYRIAIRQDRDQSNETSMIKKITCGGYQKLKFPDWINNSSTTSQNQQSQGFRTMPFGETFNVTTFLPQNCDINCTVSPRSSYSLRT